MRENKAPEKIYLHVVDDGEERWHYATCKHENVDNIEYTRTDAFIEKAWEWLDTHFHETEVEDRCGESRNVVMSELDSFKEDLLKDFKEYMKGG